MPKPLTIEQIAENFRSQLWETTRRTIGVHRQFAGNLVRWRRAAKDGANSDKAVVFVLPTGSLKAVVQIVPMETIERWASEISDLEVSEWYAKHTKTLSDSE